jgi:hypothetical protein
MKALGTINPDGLNGIARIGYGYLCLREENLSFINNRHCLVSKLLKLFCVFTFYFIVSDICQNN